MCFRDVGAERSGVIEFEGRSIDDAGPIPSIINIDAEGKLSVPEKGSSTVGTVHVRYLKMGLAGQPIDSSPKSFGHVH